ncbi:hypothetical protein L484_019020 [Morus notabilis]|uniref:F-box associated domain-containing protein n=1 Tax=Morus notabilis TaxID=981085 RepID=W9QU45_9ROSA|nr:hypothetical protein L484_019020 [Morus notabilis]
MFMRRDFDLNSGEVCTDSAHIYTDSLKEVFRNTMLNQEIIFQKQVHELHRLYGMQKTLMHNISWMEFDQYNLNKNPHIDTLPLIVAFDLVAENYYDIPLPDYEDEPCSISLKLFVGLLCLVCSYAADGVEFDEQTFPFLERVDIWVMEECGIKESWTKLLTLEPSSRTGPFNWVFPINYWKTTNRVL